jgi:uncharacterized protein (TIGR02466 family)|tara:strand:- start:56 stop:628 length:573 start_codon:yes stop_codon:yes gene_type:complete
MNNFFFPYFGPLIVKTSITKEQIKDIKKLCNKKTSYHNNLAGHIKDEYLINSTKYNTIIQPQIKTFKEVYKNFYAKELESIEIKSAWVNYMKAGDFNPPHIHTNCRFSSVLFMQFPKEILKENEKHQAASKGPGAIQFMYGESQPQDNINSYPVVPKEGDMFIFPSFVNHFVYPFKSKNVTRISIAANFI